MHLVGQRGSAGDTLQASPLLTTSPQPPGWLPPATVPALVLELLLLLLASWAGLGLGPGYGAGSRAPQKHVVGYVGWGKPGSRHQEDWKEGVRHRHGETGTVGSKDWESRGKGRAGGQGANGHGDKGQGQGEQGLEGQQGGKGLGYGLLSPTTACPTTAVERMNLRPQ